MKKRGMLLWVFLSTCLCLGALTPPAYAVDRADKREIVKRARGSYYSLRTQGLSEFQVNVTPNWRLVLKDQLRSDPAGAEKALKMLDGIHFIVTMDAKGVVKVQHKADVAPVNAQAQEGFNQIFSGMEQAMSGFFDTWSPFMLTSPFPAANDDYKLEDLTGQFYLTYKDGAADIATTMSENLVINDIKVDSPTFKSILRPQFTRGPQGLLLSGYDATYQGAGAGDRVVLQVTIGYREVEGLQLPSKLEMSGSYQGTPFVMELDLSNYQVTKAAVR